jgi:hypothetical protein
MRWLPFVGMVARAVWELSFHSTKLSNALRLWALHSLCSYFGLCGIQFLTSIDPIASVSKLTALFLYILSLSVLLERASVSKSWVHGVLLTVALANIGVVTSQSSYVASNALFQGLFNQPQVMGVIAALIMAFTGLPLSIKSAGYLPWVTVSLAILLCVLSGSRTGLLATASVLVATIIFEAQGVSRKLIRLVIAISIIGLIVTSGTLTPLLFKYSERTLGDEFKASRAALVTDSWNNFLTSPFFGIGHGMPSSSAATPEPIIKLESAVTSKPVEKGFIVTAILEELGLVGMTLLFVLFGRPFLASITTQSGRRISIAVLVVNFGEATLTSVGGLGAILWWMLLANTRLPQMNPTDGHAIIKEKAITSKKN